MFFRVIRAALISASQSSQSNIKERQRVISIRA
jgi:hypothetical protein